MFSIFEVPTGAAEITEQLGTKYKFWYTDPQLGLTLFKEGRPNTGENWAERLACELALGLGLPHALYELARFGPRAGVVTPNFVPKGSRLIHGNELLARVVGDAVLDDGRKYHARHHTISLVTGLLKGVGTVVQMPRDFAPINGVETVLDVFIGYLLFDAWIANQDRHDQNWGLIRDGDTGIVYLAPTFDHGSSLARNLLDERREVMMTTKDQGQSIEAFLLKARSAFYPVRATEKTKALGTFEAFRFATRFAPVAAKTWLGRLAAVSDDQIDEAIGLLPDEVISATARKFTAKLLKLNRAGLLEMYAQV